jgi:hypothetical protein
MPEKFGFRNSMKNLRPTIKTPNQTPNQVRFDQQWLVQVGMFLLIVIIGIGSRFWLVDMPNFKPVAAMVLFGAFYFRRSWAAVAALVVIMVLSDLRIGVYDWKLAACVYTSLALAGVMGVWIKRSIEKGSQTRLGLKQAGRFAIASLVMSTVFYVLTNGAVWWMGQWYPATWSGLVSCYAAGLPFFRSTLMGDLFFTGVLIGGYCVLESLAISFENTRQPGSQIPAANLRNVARL